MAMTTSKTEVMPQYQRPKKIQMPPLAVTTQMLQCGLFAIYASYLDMTTLLIPNTVGFVLGLIWSTLYPLRMLDEFKFQWQWQYVLSIILLLLGAITTFSFENPYMSSSVAAFVGVIMTTYPLPVMLKAIQTRNVALLGSAYMNMAMFVCCSAWVIHSSPLVEYDPFVLVSNIAGTIVQGAALVIRGYFYHKQQMGTLVPTDDVIVEREDTRLV